MRRHLRRAAVRVSTLLVADLATFAVLRWLRRNLVSWPITPGPIENALEIMVPHGYLDGWRYAVALVVGLFVTGNYGRGDQRRDVGRILAGCALATALPLWDALFQRGVGPVALQFTVTTTLVAAALLVQRLSLDRVVGRLFPRGPSAARTVAVGCTSSCAATIRSHAQRENGEVRVIGAVCAEPLPASASGLRGTIAELPSLLVRHRIETVFMCGHLRAHDFQRVADAAIASGCQLLTIPASFEVVGVQPKVVWRRGTPLVELTAPTLIGQQLVLKRLMDLIGAVLGGALMAPVLALVAVAIKLDSPGPVFFRQERVGRGGRRFRIAKFRTMVNDAERHREGLQEQSIYQDQRLFKLKEDPRATRVGRFLRRTSLDEIPQLWNVLRGEMSLVGPRPPLPSEVALYEAHHYVRFDVKPGMTGPWQVSGRNLITDFEQVIALETSYIRDWSIWSDLAILFRTFATVAGMRGAH